MGYSIKRCGSSVIWISNSWNKMDNACILPLNKRNCWRTLLSLMYARHRSSSRAIWTFAYAHYRRHSKHSLLCPVWCSARREWYECGHAACWPPSCPTLEMRTGRRTDSRRPLCAVGRCSGTRGSARCKKSAGITLHPAFDEDVCWSEARYQLHELGRSGVSLALGPRSLPNSQAPRYLPPPTRHLPPSVWYTKNSFHHSHLL